MCLQVGRCVTQSQHLWPAGVPGRPHTSPCHQGLLWERRVFSLAGLGRGCSPGVSSRASEPVVWPRSWA